MTLSLKSEIPLPSHLDVVNTITSFMGSSETAALNKRFAII
jgi:hypothetical protein